LLPLELHRKPLENHIIIGVEVDLCLVYALTWSSWICLIIICLTDRRFSTWRDRWIINAYRKKMIVNILRKIIWWMASSWLEGSYWFGLKVRLYICWIVDYLKSC